MLSKDHVSISALSDRIAQQRLLTCALSIQQSFNIRSFGSNCSAKWLRSFGHDTQVSISALSDRIAQHRRGSWSRFENSVSISALSDRIAQQNIDAIEIPRTSCFNIRSFGSNCSAIWRRRVSLAGCVFQYPLFRIELLSPYSARCSAPPIQVSISALSDRIAQQYSRRATKRLAIVFQYPLFRIELLSTAQDIAGWDGNIVSISALSDRIAQQGRTGSGSDLERCFNIRSFGSNCSAS